MRRPILLLLTALFLLSGLTACNTFKGMGKDIQALGRATEESAEDTEEDIN